uniref:Ranatachykinin-C n=1 Tax=Aquarana catesbeiana TaxID=8400 RepID=TKNC_AQUCT|nr:RecName: Full=Ranatachykinin-C; Short=RTK C [Aquarana catesbeiana]
HNPASFIGLM